MSNNWKDTCINVVSLCKQRWDDFENIRREVEEVMYLIAIAIEVTRIPVELAEMFPLKKLTSISTYRADVNNFSKSLTENIKLLLKKIPDHDLPLYKHMSRKERTSPTFEERLKEERKHTAYQKYVLQAPMY